MKKLNGYPRKYFYLLLILLLFLTIEVFSFIFIKLKLIPKYLPPVVTLYAHDVYSYWHPVNKKLKISTLCWESEVEFNSLGIKSNKEFPLKKIKPRIGILGDSMTENIQLNNNKDFAYKLQNKLKNYEIINFSVASTGLADQIDIYKNLMIQFELDYVFLFITENDFSDNYIESRRPNRISYKIYDNKIIKIERDKVFLENYFSKFNIFKREYFLYLKQLNSYKTYFYFRENMPVIIQNLRSNKNNKNNNNYKFLEEKKIIYKYLSQQFLNEIKNNQKIFIFFNINNHNFIHESQIRTIMKESWNPKIVNDPSIESITFLKKINKLSFPYMGYTCDGHYSELGAEFLSSYVSNIFLKHK